MALVERLPTTPSTGRLGSLESQRSASPAKVRSASAASNRRALDRAAASRLLGRLIRHPFASVLWKLCGITALMLGLSAIGAYATLKGTKRIPVKLGGHTGASLAAPGREWLMTETGDSNPMSLASSTPATSAPATRPLTEPLEPARSAGVTKDGKVILNLASAEDLQRLPGIGRKRAEAILALRQKLGKFRRPTDLLRVRGLGPKRLRQILPHLVVDAPTQSKSADSSRSRELGE